MHSKRFSVGVVAAVLVSASILAACLAPGAHDVGGWGLGSPCAYGGSCPDDLYCNHAKKPPCDGAVECKSYELYGVCDVPRRRENESCVYTSDCEWRFICGPDDTCVRGAAAAAPSIPETPTTFFCNEPSNAARCPDGLVCRCQHANKLAVDCYCVVDEAALDAGDLDSHGPAATD